MISLLKKNKGKFTLCYPVYKIMKEKLTREIHLQHDKHTPFAPFDFLFDFPFVLLFLDFFQTTTDQKLIDLIYVLFSDFLNCILLLG